jgi:membrane associated rhomboid family serine protease
MKASFTIIFVNVLIFLFLVIMSFINIDFALNFIAWNPSSEFFNPIQLITYQFIHADVLHLLFNMLLFSFCAFDIEKELGTKKFVIFYLVSGFIAGLAHILYSKFPVAGASGSIWGLLMIYTFLFPNRTFESLFAKVPITIFITVLFLVEIFFLITGLDKGVSNLAHIVGGLTGLLLISTNNLLTTNKSETLD